MRLSILIPTYDYTCYRLVNDLQQQLEAAQASYEIIVADDGSRDQVSVIANLKINELPHCRYIRRTENVGRAAIRNFLVDQAQGEWLLLMDSDAQVMGPGFIAGWLEHITRYEAQYDILAGGLRHPDHCPAPYCTLRYKYEKQADLLRGAEYRNREPFAQFSTFNVAFRRSVFQQVRFDETCRQYGHEDTLLGIQMADRGLTLLHIDNPLLHIGLESNEIFLRKTAVAIESLKTIGDKLQGKTRLERAAKRLRHYHLQGVFRIVFKCFRTRIERNLLSTDPDLRLFAIYKLGLFLQ